MYTNNAVLFILPIYILVLKVLYVIIGCYVCFLIYLDLCQVTAHRHLLP